MHVYRFNEHLEMMNAFSTRLRVTYVVKVHSILLRVKIYNKPVKDMSTSSQTTVHRHFSTLVIQKLLFITINFAGFSNNTIYKQ